MGQSRAIERLGAELEFKREKLDDLKADNKRMEEKIDRLDTKFDNFINKSDSKDSKLDKRLTKIETKLEEQDKAIENNKQTSRDNYLRLGAVLTVVTVVLGFATFFFK